MILSAVLVLVLLAPVSEAQWWTSTLPTEARDRWLETAADDSERARTGLVALLTAREEDPSGEAAAVWSLLRGSPQLGGYLRDVLSTPRKDELLELLGDPGSGALELLRAVALDEGAGSQARAAALEALGRCGPGERELLLRLLLDQEAEAALRTAAGRGLRAGASLSPGEHAKVVAELASPQPEDVQAVLMDLASRRPDPGLTHQLSLLARGRRSAKLQAASLRAFVTACEHASGDESTLAEARRGLAELSQSVSTPLQEAAVLAAQRWLDPPSFDREAHSQTESLASWRRFFTDPHASSFWLDAVFEHGAYHERSEVQVVDRVIVLLAGEPEGSPASLSEVLVELTEQRPRWLADSILRALRQSGAAGRRSVVQGLAAVPAPYDPWNLWEGAAVALSPVWDRHIPPDVLSSLLARALRKRTESRWLAEGALAALRGRPELEEVLLDARLPWLRRPVIESVLQGRRPTALRTVVDTGSRDQRLRALEALVALHDAHAVAELAAVAPARVLEALFGGLLNEELPKSAALAELGIHWLDRDSDPPVGPWETLLGEGHLSLEEWTVLWQQLRTFDMERDEAQAVVEARLRSFCTAPATLEMRSAWQVLAGSSHPELAQAARRRLEPHNR